MNMKTYKVLSTLNHDNHEYKLGDTITLAEEAAKDLLLLNVVELNELSLIEESAANTVTTHVEITNPKNEQKDDSTASADADVVNDTPSETKTKKAK